MNINSYFFVIIKKVFQINIAYMNIFFNRIDATCLCFSYQINHQAKNFSNYFLLCVAQNVTFSHYLASKNIA